MKKHQRKKRQKEALSQLWIKKKVMNDLQLSLLIHYLQ